MSIDYATEGAGAIPVACATPFHSLEAIIYDRSHTYR